MKRTLIFGLLVLIVFKAGSQVVTPVTWTFSQKKLGENKYQLEFRASIEKGWHMYGLNISEGPIPTTFKFEKVEGIEQIGEVKPVTKPLVKMDPFFNAKVPVYFNEAVFSQEVRITKGEKLVLKGSVECGSCNDNSCTPPQEKEFEFVFNTNQSGSLGSSEKADTAIAQVSAEKKPDQEVKSTTAGKTVSENRDGSNKSLWSYFLIAFLAGLGGVLTPCVYPMIPMTVSFFMRGQDNKTMAMINGFVFGLSIILIYTLFGVIVSLTSAGADFANQMNSHWIPNSIFFLLFVVFAASFFGMFELILPSSMTNKVDQMADKGGILGAFFMALTLVIVSFSCTGPIVGSLLVEAAGGLALKPILGMFGFSLAFALPFTLFAIFPSMLKSLPKSGGWLNSVKVVLGFIMLAFSLKFLSNMNESYHLGIIGREIYLAIWIVLFALLGLYLLGKIKFAHDSDLKYITVPRLLLVIISFTFVVYLIPGMFGAPLKGISSLIPPAKGHSFDLSRLLNEPKTTVSATDNVATICETPKFGDILELPFGLKGYFDFNQGLACAKASGKPVFLDFKGHTCSNCKRMENEVWSDPLVQKRLSENFVIIALYVDDRTELPEQDWVTSKFDGKVKKTLGKVNADLQISKFNSNTQPLYAIVDGNGNELVPPIGVELDINKFLGFLDSGIAAYKNAR